LDYLQLKDDPRKDRCVLQEDKPGTIFKTTTKVALKFNDVDELDMFRLYIRQFLNEKEEIVSNVKNDVIA
jgi:hypothetical protein